MKARLLCAAILTLALPAQAVSVLVSGSGNFSIVAGDSYDAVIATESSHVDWTGGTVLGDLTLLDSSTATLAAGSPGGTLGVFGDAVATVAIESGTASLDGFALADDEVVGAIECPTCLIDATVAGGGSFSAVTSVSQNGQVRFDAQPVPEPGTFALVGLGLLGLGLAGRRRG